MNGQYVIKELENLIKTTKDNETKKVLNELLIKYKNISSILQWKKG
jgi:hypothetical protein